MEVVVLNRSPSGGIGIRAGLKNQWPLGRVGSTPTSGTNTKGHIHLKQVEEVSAGYINRIEA